MNAHPEFNMPAEPLAPEAAALLVDLGIEPPIQPAGASQQALDRRGVSLRCISDNDKEFDLGSDIGQLRAAGIPVALDRTDAHMHHKFAIFDGMRLLNGSYNWTRSAASFNEENLVLSNDPSLVRRFADEFDSLWKELQASR